MLYLPNCLLTATECEISEFYPQTLNLEVSLQHPYQVPDDATMTSVQATNKLEVIKPAPTDPAAAAATKPLTEAERIKLRAER